MSWGEYPELSGWAKCNQEGPYEKEVGGGQSQEKR